MTELSSRRRRLAERDPRSADIAGRLLGIAQQVLAQSYVDGEFVFTLKGSQGPDGTWRVTPTGVSRRYAAITALGLLRCPEEMQRAVLGGETVSDLITRLGQQLGETTDVGDTALICWAAAEAKHEVLEAGLRRLAELQGQAETDFVVEAAWVVSALVAARSHADVEQPLARARERLLKACGGGAYPHVIGGGGSRLRSHVGSFAAQVYPVQALARLHHSADDQQALAIANCVAGSICTAQGKEGQWWWHYDARTGGVVEGYPVYTVHQQSMGPMALLDLSEAGGDDHLDSICRGLRWLESKPETTETLLPTSPVVTWRKVARNDPRKAARGLQAATTQLRPGLHLPLLDRVFPPGVVDHECRPYEFGWLLMTWES